MYAVIESGGKQYKVEEGSKIEIEKLELPLGAEVKFDNVLLISTKDGEALMGKPFLKNVEVVGEVITQDRGEKIVVFKKKRRKNYRKTIGHRQYYTGVKINKISVN